MNKILLTIILTLSLGSVSIFACDGKGKALETLSPETSVK